MQWTDDSELLLLLFTKCLPLAGAAMATQALLDRYGSYADAVAAPYAELMTVPFLGQSGVTLLKCVHSAAARLAGASLRRSPIFEDRAALHRYLQICTARDKIEIFRVLYLNANNCLVNDCILAEGFLHSVDVSLRSIAVMAMALDATSIILVHNHPSGEPVPSEQDLFMTAHIENTASTLGLTLADHIIIGNGKCLSLRELTWCGLTPKPSNFQKTP